MKKGLLTIFTFLIMISLIFVTGNINVNASHLDDKSMIYDIDKFEINVTTGKISINGWAFIHNVHNNYNGNKTEIKIYAKSSTGDLEMADLTYHQYYNENLYYANCTRKWNQTAGRQICVQTYEQASCDPNNSTSSCRYDNVGFEATLDLDDLREFGDGAIVKFIIEVTATTTSGNTYSKSEEIVVSNGAAQNIENDEPIVLWEEDDVTITVSNLTNQAKMRASSARVLTNNGDYKVASNYYWNQHSTFVIASKGYCENCSNSELDGFGMYELYTPLASGGAKPGGNGETGWAYASWIELIGNSVEIKIGDPPEEMDCPKESESIPDIEDCDEEANFSQVINKDIKITDKYYEDDDEFDDYNLKDDECTDKTPSVTRTITATACITQTGTARFDISTDEIYSGGGFYFYATYYGKASYQFCKDDDSEYNITMKITDKYCDEYTGSCYTGEDTCGKKGKSRCYEPCTKTKLNSTSETYEITSSSDEWEIVTEYMQGLLEEPDDDAVAKSLDSNTVGTTKNVIDYWYDDYTNNDNKKYNSKNAKKHWEPGEVVSYEIEFDLARACIDRRTAYVRYIDPDDECDDDEVDGDQLYYIPLKQPTGTFPIELSIDDVNVLEDETWSIDYACEVDNVQNLYDVDEDGNGDGSFKFIYRPITLANPFPNRSPGTNWKVYTYSSSLQEKMARKNIDYEITIGPQQIASIKSKYTSKYTSLNSITDSGNSTILDELTFKTQTNSYNKLGECTKDCWTIDEGW